MTRLILTTDASDALAFMEDGRADIAVGLVSRFVWGPLPSDTELETSFAARVTQKPGGHWLDYVSRPKVAEIGWEDLSLIEACRRCKTVELWMGAEPNAQLVLVWLLDYLRTHIEAVKTDLILHHVDSGFVDATPEELKRWKCSNVLIENDHLETARLTWQAYRAATPEACFDLLGKDLSALPLLGPALFELIEELPLSATGPGATEMRLLELIANGYERTNALFYLRELRGRYIFGEFELGSLLEGLAHGPRPAVAGLDDVLRALSRENFRDRLPAYQRSRLSLTEFGKAVVAHKEDFSRHNPIDRWWGGTHLTNDNLWRWHPTLMRPAP